MAKVQVEFTVDLPTQRSNGKRQRTTLPMLKQEVQKLVGRHFNVTGVKARHLEMYGKPEGWTRWTKDKAEKGLRVVSG